MIIQIHRVRDLLSIRVEPVHSREVARDRISHLQDPEAHRREAILLMEILRDRETIHQARQDNRVHRALVIRDHLLTPLQETLRDRQEVLDSLIQLQEDWIRQAGPLRTRLLGLLMHGQEARSREVILLS